MENHPSVTSSLQGRITLMFVLLATVLTGLMASYWFFALEPRLQAEARATSQTVAQAHAAVLVEALNPIRGEIRRDRIERTIDRMLRLSDASTGSPFLLAVELEIDDAVVAVPAGEIDLEQGDVSCRSCFVTEIPLASEATRQRLGMARFYGSDVFFRHLRADVRNRLLAGSCLALGLLVLAWRTVALLLRPLAELAASLRGWDVEKPWPGGELSGPLSEEICRVQLAMDDLLGKIRDRTSALREARDRLQAILDNSGACINIKNVEGRYVLVNNNMAELFHLTPEEMLGKSSADLLPAERAEPFLIHHRLALAATAPVEFEEQAVRDGERRTYLSVRFPLFDDRGAPNAVGVIATDITERKQAEEAVRKLNEGLERLVEERTAELHASQAELVRKERLATLGQLTATVSHELRNPLGAMRPSLYLIRKLAAPENPRVQTAIERVERGISRCDHIIDELLDFTRIRELDFQLTPVDPWLSGLLDELEVPADVELRRELDAGSRLVQLDPDRFRRAVINVYENGCQAMVPEDPPAAVSNGSRLTVSSRILDGRLEIAVADSGPGIPPDVQPRIFEPLFSTKGFGVGLGLPTARQIVEQHGGGIEIETVEGRGTRVLLWLPPARQPGPEGEEEER